MKKYNKEIFADNYRELHIDLDTYDIENDPECIFDVDRMDDNTLFVFKNPNDYDKYIKIFDKR